MPDGRSVSPQLFRLRVVEPVRVYGHIPLVDPLSQCIGQPVFILHCFHCNKQSLERVSKRELTTQTLSSSRHLDCSIRAKRV